MFSESCVNSDQSESNILDVEVEERQRQIVSRMQIRSQVLETQKVSSISLHSTATKKTISMHTWPDCPAVGTAIFIFFGLKLICKW